MSQRSFLSFVASLVLLSAAVPAVGDNPPKPTSDAPYADLPTPKSAPPHVQAPAPDDDPYATPPPSNSADPPWVVEKRREKLYGQARKLAGEGRWKEALEKFREVNEIRSDPRVLLWKGF